MHNRIDPVVSEIFSNITLIATIKSYWLKTINIHNYMLFKLHFNSFEEIII